MGNYGDTMDYWYHRAAIVMWQQADHYNALLEFNPLKVIEELLTQVPASGKAQLAELVRHLLKDWSGLKHDVKSADYNRVLKLSGEINDADLADALLLKLDYKALSVSSVPHLIRLEKLYGVTWCIHVLKNWHTDSTYQNKVTDIENLDKIISRLRSAKDGTHDELTTWMLSHQWQVIQADNEAKLKYYQAARLQEQAAEQFKAAGELIRAALICRNQSIHDS